MPEAESTFSDTTYFSQHPRKHGNNIAQTKIEESIVKPNTFTNRWSYFG